MLRIRHWVLSWGLWPRMALAISLGFLALFAAFAGLSERALRATTDRLLDERLVIAQTIAGQIDGVLQHAIADLEQAYRVADIDPTNPNPSEKAAMLAHTHGLVATFPQGIALLDSAGHVVLSHPLDLYAPGTDMSALPHVTQALEHREVTISDPFGDPIKNEPVVAVIVPVYAGDHFVGLLTGLVDLRGQSIMLPLQRAATLSDSGHAALVDSQGRELASTLNLPFLSPGEHGTFYRWAMTQRQPVVETVPFELDLPGEKSGELHVMAFVPLQMAPWGVAVGGDLDETLAGVTRLRLSMILLSAAALAGAWLATLVGTQSLVRPLERLTVAAQQIAEGDLNTPLRAPEGGEVGALATALEHMRTQLLTNIEELANWNEVLETRVTQRAEELRQEQSLTQQLLRRVITAQEEERARLSWELHDETGQTLTAVKFTLDRLVKLLPAEAVEAHEHVERIRELTERAMTDLRRVIAALRPGVLDQLGLVPALAWVADHTLSPLGVTVSIDSDGLKERLPGEIETLLFRIAQEAISNVARHSQARHLTVRLANGNGQVTMTLTDDGQGFDPSTVAPALDHGRGLGLASMQERASLAGGRVTVESTPGWGTTVQVVVPYARRGKS